MNSSDEARKIEVQKTLDWLSEIGDIGWFQGVPHSLPESLDRQLDRYMVKTGLERNMPQVLCVLQLLSS